MKKIFAIFVLVFSVNCCQASYHFGDPIYSRQSEEDRKFQSKLVDIFLKESNLIDTYEAGLRENNLDDLRKVVSQTQEFMTLVKELPNSTQVIIRDDVIRVGNTYVQTLAKIKEMTGDKN